MARKLICGRTRPDTRESLREVVERLAQRDADVKPHQKLFPRLSRRVAFLPNMRIFARPLPPVRLVDGSRPLEVDTSMSANWFGGTRPFGELADPSLDACWRVCMELRPARAHISFLIHPPSLLNEVVFGLDLYQDEKPFRAELSMYYQMREGEPDGLGRFLAALNLERYPPLDPMPRTALDPRAYRRVIVPEIPADAELWPRLIDSLRRLGWTDPGVIESVQLIVKEYEERYVLLRPRLNAIVGGWNCEIPGWYREGFDPYSSPPVPPPGEEYRYPVAMYLKPGRTSDEPTLQVDVVHTATGSFLEFLSADGEKRLRNYSELAGVDLEIWRGPLADRWGTS